MPTAIDTTGGKIRIHIAGVDYTPALVEGMYSTNSLDVDGLITANCQLTLAQSEHCPVSLDPLVSSQWRLGLQVQLFFEYTYLVQDRIATLIVQTNPIYDEWEQTLELDLVDYLTYANGKTPQDQLDDEDFTPAAGKSRREVINLLVGKTNFFGTSLLGNGPEGKIYSPAQKFGDRGWVSVAGEIAYGDPDDCYWLYCAPASNLDSISWSEMTSAPKLFLTPSNTPNTTRLQGDEYSKPVEKLYVTSSKIHTCTIEGDQLIERRYNALSSTVKRFLELRGKTEAEIPYRIPTYELRRNTTFDGNTVTIIETEKTIGTFFVEGVTGQNNSTNFRASRISTYTKVYGIGTDKLGNEVTFIKSCERIDQRLEQSFDGTQILTLGQVTITEGLDEWQRQRETWDYDEDFYCIKYVKAIDQKLGDLYTIIVPPVGTPNGLIPPQYQAANRESWVPVSETTQEWNRLGCTVSNGDEWQLKETTLVPSALAGTGNSRYDLVDDGNGTKITPNSSPPETERKPKPYNTSEEDIAGNWTATPNGAIAFFDTKRTENIPWLDSDEVCEKKAKQIQDLDYGLALGRNFEFAPTDALMGQIIAKPVFRFDYQHYDGTVNAYLFQGFALNFSQTETLIELDAPLLGSLKTYSTSTSGNTIFSPGLFLTESGQQVVFYPNYYGAETVYGLVPGQPYYAYPDGNGGFTVSVTPGGPPITLTPGNPGTVSPVRPGPIYDTPIHVTPQYRISASFGGSSDQVLPANFGGYRVSATFADFGLGAPGYRIGATFAAVATARITSAAPLLATAGTIVTIKGSGFTGATAVSFGGTAAASFEVVSDRLITATVGTGASGAISVTTATGAVLSLTGFQFLSAGSGGGGFEPISETLSWSNDGDTNGVFYFIGTRYGVGTFSNPANNGGVLATSSSVLSGSTASAYNVLDRTGFVFHSEIAANSWLQIDLGPGRTLQLNRYAIQGRSDSNTHFPRSWKLQGSYTGDHWYDLDTKSGNTDIAAVSQWASWSVTTTVFFRFFRILQTGVSSSGFDILCFTELELYGEFFANYF